MTHPKTYYMHHDSPLGPLLLTSDGSALTSLSMTAHAHGPAIAAEWVCDCAAASFAETKQQISDYFAGVLTDFVLSLAPKGTEFQKRVWAELSRIPYGETCSYGELARRLGDPNAARAVGLANGRNPIFLIVPCHRVLGASGKMTGYGGGIERKAALLALERSVAHLAGFAPRGDLGKNLHGTS